MPKKRLDATTLEAIAEIICGSGQGAGGGPAYGTPGPYRSKSEIHSFFARVGVDPKGESSTRKWFVLESLQVLNRCWRLGETLTNQYCLKISFAVVPSIRKLVRISRAKPSLLWKDILCGRDFADHR